MYIKKFLDFIFPTQGKDLSKDCWRGFKSSANVYNKFEKNEEYRLMFNRAWIFFEKQGPREYELVVEPIET